jgi:hypothetical protein
MVPEAAYNSFQGGFFTICRGHDIFRRRPGLPAQGRILAGPAPDLFIFCTLPKCNGDVKYRALREMETGRIGIAEYSPHAYTGGTRETETVFVMA